jgi:hypothetical protein
MLTSLRQDLYDRKPFRPAKFQHTDCFYGTAENYVTPNQDIVYLSVPNVSDVCISCRVAVLVLRYALAVYVLVHP